MPVQAMLSFTPPPESSPNVGGRLVTADHRTLPLRSTHLEAEAGGGIARVVLTQRFLNPHTEPLTVEYLLPLPSDAAVSGFSFILGERRVVGQVDRKADARARFEQAMIEGHSAALLEQTRTSVFAQTIGNVPPGAEIIAEIVIDQPLRWLDEGAWEWRFPTVVSPRYMGAAGRVADAAALAVDVAERGTGVTSTLSLIVADAITGSPESSSHALEQTVEIDVGRSRVRFSGDRGVALDRDVVVRWPVAQPRISACSLAARPAAAAHEGHTFALVSVIPPLESAYMRPIPRDLIFLLDTSGSMAGRPLSQAKRVAGAMIDTLGEEDRIELIEFGSQVNRFRREPLVATRDGKQAAKQWLDSLRASGGTEMHEAILEAIRPLREECERQVVLVTDGQIGFEEAIVQTLLTSLPAGARLHTVGIGSAVNRSLTSAAARAGCGSEFIVDLDEDVERVIPRLLARTSAPLVTDLSIEGSDSIVVAPRAIPDLYARSPALIAVRVRSPGELRVRGRTAEGTFEQRVTIPELALGQGPQGVTALFGRESVEDLEMRRVAASDAELDANIEALGLCFQIATRKTSWIAVTDERTVDPSREPRRVRQPQELPYGTSIEGLGLRAVADRPLALAEALEMPMEGLSEAKYRRVIRGYAGMPEPKKTSAGLLWLFLLALLILAIATVLFGGHCG